MGRNRFSGVQRPLKCNLGTVYGGLDDPGKALAGIAPQRRGNGYRFREAWSGMAFCSERRSRSGRDGNPAAVAT
jgi:hypothetical protein